MIDRPSRSTVLIGVLIVALTAIAATRLGFLPDLTDQEELAEVTVFDGDGQVLATIYARIADNFTERYQGLSGTENLEEGRGMLFVFDWEGRRNFVMRGMNYGLDMIFIGSDLTITAIHEAPLPPEGTPEGELTVYSGRAQWVLEVPLGYSSSKDISVGDRVEINY